MSLINKMLNDLESREVLLADKQDIMLDGLYSAYDIELEKQPEQGKSWLILLVITLMAVAVYAVGKYDWLTGQNNDALLYGAILQKEGMIAEPSAPNTAVNIETTVVPEYRISLRLDELLNSYGVDTAATVSSAVRNEKRIEKIEIVSAGQKTVLSLSMPVDAQYSAYTLESPDRLVLQINGVEYEDALPALESHPWITNVRKRLDEQGNFIFVIESSTPLSIVNSGYEQAGEKYNLRVTFLSGQKEESQSAVAEHSLKFAELGTAGSDDEAVTKGDVVKIVRQPGEISPVDQMLLEGRSLYESGLVAEGLDKLYATVKSDESHVRARATLAVILVEQEQGDLAISLLEDGLRQFPEQTVWSRLLGRIHMDAGNYDVAREVLSRNMPPVTEDPEYHALYAAVLQKMAIHDKAAITYRKLVDVQPGNGLWWMGLAISLEAISRNKDALFAYRNALNGQLLTPETHRYIVERIRYLDNRNDNESS